MSQIILGVPGPWKERAELMEALARQGTDHMFAGTIFFEQSTHTSCQFEFYDRDPELRRTFGIAGQGAFSHEELQALDGHASVACVIFDNPGYETARAAARFARVLLEAGGFAVKVDSAGVAHPRDRWLADSASEDSFVVYSLFVVLVGGDERFYSCGMQNFGLPDAAVPETLGSEEGARLLNVFNHYRLTESPTLNDGETFSLTPDSPRFRLKHEPYDEGYDPETPLYNPHGLWSLEVAPAARRCSRSRRD